VKDGFSAEKESAKCAEMKKIQSGDVSYEENSAAAASRARLEIDGVSAEKSQMKAKVRVLLEKNKQLIRSQNWKISGTSPVTSRYQSTSCKP
jgi:hypothetical protein